MQVLQITGARSASSGCAAFSLITALQPRAIIEPLILNTFPPHVAQGSNLPARIFRPSSAHMTAIFLVSVLLSIAKTVYSADESSWLGNLAYASFQNNWENNPVWPLGSVQTLRWRTEYLSYYISLWQHDPQFSGGGLDLGRIYSMRLT